MIDIVAEYSGWDYAVELEEIISQSDSTIYLKFDTGAIDLYVYYEK